MLLLIFILGKSLHPIEKNKNGFFYQHRKRGPNGSDYHAATDWCAKCWADFDGRDRDCREMDWIWLRTASLNSLLFNNGDAP